MGPREKEVIKATEVTLAYLDQLDYLGPKEKRVIMVKEAHLVHGDLQEVQEQMENQEDEDLREQMEDLENEVLKVTVENKDLKAYKGFKEVQACLDHQDSLVDQDLLVDQIMEEVTRDLQGQQVVHT